PGPPRRGGGGGGRGPAGRRRGGGGRFGGPGGGEGRAMKSAWWVLLLTVCTGSGCMGGRWVFPLFREDKPAPPQAAAKPLPPRPPVTQEQVNETNARAKCAALA